MFSQIYQNSLQLASLTAGCFYPAFVSFKYLNAQQRLNNDENNANLSIWLTYWVGYAIWCMFDFLIGDSLPLMREMKLIFVIWLLPSVGAGSQMSQKLLFKEMIIESNKKPKIMPKPDESTGRDGEDNLSLKTEEVLKKTESQEILFKEMILESKKKPKIMPKPDQSTGSLKTVEDLNNSKSQELLFKEMILKSNMLAKMMPRPGQGQSTPLGQDKMMDLNPNQDVAIANETEID